MAVRPPSQFRQQHFLEITHGHLIPGCIRPALVGILPEGSGARNTYPPREHDKRRNAFLATPSIGVLPQDLGAFNACPPDQTDNSRNALPVTSL